MDLAEALEEVLNAASQPKQYPPGVTPPDSSNEPVVNSIDVRDLKRRAWHESLTPAQETVCRWVWDNCAQHFEPWEEFEAGFLFDYNNNHELAIWVKIAAVFVEFLKRHPSVNKRQVIGELCRFSAGRRITEFKGSRAKELLDLWQQRPQDQLDSQ